MVKDAVWVNVHEANGERKEVRTFCHYDTETDEVFDIGQVDTAVIEGYGPEVEEYVLIDEKRHEVRKEDDTYFAIVE